MEKNLQTLDNNKGSYYMRTMAISILLITYSITTINAEKAKLSLDQEYFKIAQILEEHDQKDRASYYYKQILILSPDHLEANFHLGNILFQSKRYDEALLYYQKIIDIDPENASAHLNKAYVLHTQGQIDQAAQSFERAVEVDPMKSNAHRLLGRSCLLRGDFSNGWKEFSIADNLDHQSKSQAERDSVWHGQNLAGKTIFVRDFDGGDGDVFQFVRFLKPLKQQGATIILETKDRVIPLLSRCNYIDILIPENSPEPRYDYWATLLNIVAIIKPTPQTLKDIEIPYIEPDPTLVKKWGTLLTQDNNFKIGLCWQGKLYKHYDFDAEKSMNPSPLYPLTQLDGVSIYSLQKFPRDKWSDSFMIHKFGPDFDNINGHYMDTAAVMKHLDLVITVDTSIAHIAGALGVPVWVMLPYVSDWRWMLERSDSSWYPTMRLFRQPKSDDWESVVCDIVNALQKIL